jgi:hypothetical protein
MLDPLLAACAQTLLQGEVICKQRYENLFIYLDDKANRERISHYLQMVERDVRISSDMNAYVCCYAHFTASDVKESCRAQFQSVVDTLQPLVEWLCLLMDCSPTQAPLRPGATISFATLLDRISQSEAQCDTLAAIAKSKVFGSNSPDPSGQLKQIMKKLVDLGYLVSYGLAGTNYRATGKWSVLYDQMGFIRTYESLEEPGTESQARLI